MITRLADITAKAVNYFFLLMTQEKVSEEKLKKIGISRFTAYRIRKVLIEEGYLDENNNINLSRITPRDIELFLLKYSHAALGKREYEEVRFLVLSFITDRMVDPVQKKVISLIEEQNENMEEAKEVMLDMDSHEQKIMKHIVALQQYAKTAYESYKLSEAEREDPVKMLNALADSYKYLEKAFLEMGFAEKEQNTSLKDKRELDGIREKMEKSIEEGRKALHELKKIAHDIERTRERKITDSVNHVSV